MTNKQYQEVLAAVDVNDKFLYSYQNEVHEGLIGLVAGKYTRQYNRPSFVMSLDKEKNMYKGSARGIEGLSLSSIFKQVEDVLDNYGGHALAGGFSVSVDNVEILKSKLTRYLEEQLENYQQPLVEVLEVSEDEISKNAVKQLELLEPLGNGNEEVCFYAKNLSVKKVTPLSNGKHLRFDLELPKVRGQALYFNHGELYEQYKNIEKINVVGKFSINVFNNFESVNIIIEGIK